MIDELKYRGQRTNKPQYCDIYTGIQMGRRYLRSHFWLLVLYYMAHTLLLGFSKRPLLGRAQLPVAES